MHQQFYCNDFIDETDYSNNFNSNFQDDNINYSGFVENDFTRSVTTFISQNNNYDVIDYDINNDYTYFDQEQFERNDVDMIFDTLSPYFDNILKEKIELVFFDFVNCLNYNVPFQIQIIDSKKCSRFNFEQGYYDIDYSQNLFTSYNIFSNSEKVYRIFKILEVLYYKTLQGNITSKR